jgi:NADH:ubiquinone oxidoreductase subunit 2 (subunit N)
MYFHEKHSDTIVNPSIMALSTVVVCAVLLIVLGLFPSIIVQAAQQFR